MPKIAVFIDAGNLWNTYKVLGKLLDFSTFHQFFSQQFKGEIFKIFYYVAHPREGTRPKDDINRQHKFFTYLKKGLGFEVIKKPLKTIHIRDHEGTIIYDQNTGKAQSIEKGNFDVEIAIDALHHAGAFDIAVFLTGDSDFLPLVNYLRQLKQPKKVYVFSSEGSISHELRTGTDGYFDIAKFPEIHGKVLVRKEEKTVDKV